MMPSRCSDDGIERMGHQIGHHTTMNCSTTRCGADEAFAALSGPVWPSMMQLPGTRTFSFHCCPVHSAHTWLTRMPANLRIIYPHAQSAHHLLWGCGFEHAGTAHAMKPCLYQTARATLAFNHQWRERCLPAMVWLWATRTTQVYGQDYNSSSSSRSSSEPRIQKP
ncbi:hypothetical protein BDW69DRAFT_57295 [Aspergillus filifer]